MCILLLSTAHPQYPIIILSNRDEFLHRPTQRAAYWDPPHEHVYSGRDLARPEKGTWLGVSRDGRVAVLTNFRESSAAQAIGEKSRGAMVTSFLTSPIPEGTSTKDWIHNVLVTGEMRGVGGFSMMCGTLRPGHGNLEHLAVITNRTGARDDGVESEAHWIGGTKEETHGLSNSLFNDPWPKVKLGEKLLSEVVKEAAETGMSEDELVERCFGVLSHDTMPVIQANDTYETELEALTKSVFIPPFKVAPEKKTDEEKAEEDANNANVPTEKEEREQKKPSPEPRPPPKSLLVDTSVASNLKVEQVHDICTTPVDYRHLTTEQEEELFRASPLIYGTQTQTVILVDNKGRLKYVERRLFDEGAKPIVGKERDIVEEFDIQGWDAGKVIQVSS